MTCMSFLKSCNNYYFSANKLLNKVRIAEILKLFKLFCSRIWFLNTQGSKNYLTLYCNERMRIEIFPDIGLSVLLPELSV